MQLPSFRKPAFNPFSLLMGFVALLILGLAAIGLISFLWLISVFIIWASVVIWGVFTIQSELFIRTRNTLQTKEKKIAITFDDGPHENTAEILSILNKYEAKASFFVIGKHADENAELLKRIHSDGHLIGNHTYSHNNKFPIFPLKNMIEDIAKCSIIIKKITGKQPQTFRPPFGVTNPRVARAIKSLRLYTIGWNVRSLDTQIKDPKRIISRIIRRTKPGSIILLHDSTIHCPQVLEQILKHFSNINYTFVRVDELSKE